MKKRTILMWAMILPLSVVLFISGCKKDKAVDFTTLDATILLAQTSHDAAVEGTEVGQYPVGAKAELQTAIDAAQSVRDLVGVTQDQVNTANTSLNTSIVAFDAQKIIDLDVTIKQAQALHDAAVEGTELGQYVAGSKAALQTSIDLAQSVRDLAGVTQTQLNAANTNLQVAIAAFEAQKVTDVSSANLVAHWMFNGNANDATANGNNGTPTAGHAFWGGGPAPALTTDRFNNPSYCYHFDQGCNIEIPYSTALNPPDMTISLWIKMEEQPNNDFIIAMNRWNGWKLNLQDANFLFFTIKTDQGIYDRDSNPGAILPDVWTYVTVTFTSGSEKFYINGDVVATWDNTPGIPAADDQINVTIGSDLPTSVYSPDDTSPFYVNWGGYFKGNIDDVRFYNVVLTPTQIISLYNYEKDNVVE